MDHDARNFNSGCLFKLLRFSGACQHHVAQRTKGGGGKEREILFFARAQRRSGSSRALTLLAAGAAELWPHGHIPRAPPSTSMIVHIEGQDHSLDCKRSLARCQGAS
eukprot:2859734-Pyramimonas_sp.AAC.1